MNGNLEQIKILIKIFCIFVIEYLKNLQFLKIAYNFKYIIVQICVVYASFHIQF